MALEHAGNRSPALWPRAPSFIQASDRRDMAAAAAAETATTQNNILEWVKKDNRRLLHVVYRVADLDKTIKYACSQHVLGVF